MSSSTIVVLGAGATRGASLVDPLSHPCLRPLDTDFFTQLQRAGNPKCLGTALPILQPGCDRRGVDRQVARAIP